MTMPSTPPSSSAGTGSRPASSLRLPVAANSRPKPVPAIRPSSTAPRELSVGAAPDAVSSSPPPPATSTIAGNAQMIPRSASDEGRSPCTSPTTTG